MPELTGRTGNSSRITYVVLHAAEIAYGLEKKGIGPAISLFRRS